MVVVFELYTPQRARKVFVIEIYFLFYPIFAIHPCFFGIQGKLLIDHFDQIFSDALAAWIFKEWRWMLIVPWTRAMPRIMSLPRSGGGALFGGSVFWCRVEVRLLSKMEKQQDFLMLFWPLYWESVWTGFGRQGFLLGWGRLVFRG